MNVGVINTEHVSSYQQKTIYFYDNFVINERDLFITIAYLVKLVYSIIVVA
jgi:hypothetical protein